MKNKSRLRFLYLFGYTMGLIMFVGVWLVAPLAIALWMSFAVICMLFKVPVPVIGTAAMTLLAMVGVTHFYAPLSLYSEQLAVYVFYFLCLMVLLRLRELMVTSHAHELFECERTTFSPRCILAGMSPQRLSEIRAQSGSSESLAVTSEEVVKKHTHDMYRVCHNDS